MRVQIKLWKLVVAAALMALGGELAAGCGGPRGGFRCEVACDCEGCSLAAQDRCYADADADEARAERLGCYNFYDAFIACEELTGDCRGSEFRTDCGVERGKWQNCIGR